MFRVLAAGTARHVVVQDEMVDIVAEGFDSGIRFGGRVPENMIDMSIGRSLL